MDSSPSTSLYTLGRGMLYIGEWTGSTPPSIVALTAVGNCPRLEVEISEEKLEHYSSMQAARLKDKTVVLETGYTINFDLEEASLANLQWFLKATVTGAKNHILQANQAVDKEFLVRFVTNNTSGPNQKWQFHRVQLSPGGALGLITDEWQAMSFTGEGLADVSNNPNSPLFNVEFVTTTTT